MFKRKAVLLLLVPIALFAAKARLYNQKTGEDLDAKFSGKWVAGGHGKFEFITASGEKVAGEWSADRPGDYGWGTIYETGGSATLSTTRGSSTIRGKAVASGAGRFVRCEFVAGRFSGHGSGTCEDNNGSSYDLTF